MREFKDCRERTWTVDATVGALKRVRDILGLNLADPMAATEADSIAPITRIDLDTILLVDVVYLIVKPQATEQGVKDEEFGAAIDGKALSAARDALMGALIDFFRQRGRTDVVKAIQTQMEIVNRAAAVAEETIASDEMTQILKTKIDQIRNLASLQDPTATGTPVGSTPASSE